MHTHNVNVKTAAQETAGRWGKNTSVHHKAVTKSPFRRLLAAARDAADYSVACEQEASHHYGHTFTRLDHAVTWFSGFISGFRTHLSRKEDYQMHIHNLKMVVKKPQLGKAADVLPLLRIRLSDTCVIEFVEVDIRFNDCRRWQILEGEKVVLFSPRSHEKLRDVRREATIALDMHEKQAEERVTAARAVLKLLAEYPTFAALAAHPARTDNA